MSLADIIARHNDSFRSADPAGRREPVPPGEYAAVLTNGEMTTSRNGTDGYKLTFRVAAGPHEGRLLFHDLWFTGPAMPYTRRDLATLGVADLAALERPLPRFRCRVKVTVRKGDSGAEFNRVAGFTVDGRDDPPASPFPPKPNGGGE